MGKLMNWLLSHLPFFKQVDGYKVQIGFIMMVLWGLLNLAGQLIVAFPQFAWLIPMKDVLGSLYYPLSDMLQQLGLSFMVVGVGHDELKNKYDQNTK